MVRITLKNTFLSFDEHDEDDELDLPRFSSRQAASPRSRSLECPSPSRVPEEHGQIVKLNRLLDSESQHPSPSLRSTSGACSPSALPTSSQLGGDVPGLSMLPEAAVPTPGPAPPQRTSVGGASSSSQDPPAQQKHLPFGNAGPSAQELRQLQRRLEEACQGRRGSQDSSSASTGAAGCKVVHVASACSVSTMANESSEEGEEPAGQAQAQAAKLSKPPMMHQVRSTNSVCSLVSASEQVEDRGEMHYGEETVEFDLTIEEGPQAHLWSSMSEQEEAFCSQPVDAPWVRPRPPAPRAPAGSSASASPPRRPSPPRRGRGSGRASPGSASPGSASPGSASPSGASPRCRMYSPPNSPKQVSPRDSRYSQWRPLPKEYRHGHVPKNLNLAEEYRNSDQAAPPTTLMIRNIPNRYTQRELIMELEDLGFQGTFDFLYIPLDKGTMSNVGYAFVNFVEPSWAEKCMAAFQNYRFKRHRKISGKIAAISVAHIQGLEANLAHYENAAVNTAKLKQRRPVIVANISQSLTGAIMDDS